MKKHLTLFLLCLCGMAQQVSAQGYYLYKNGQRQSYRANEMDSLACIFHTHSNMPCFPIIISLHSFFPRKQV